MAKTKELRFTVSITVNLGNYESARLEVGESIDLEEGDDPKEEMAQMVKRVKRVASREAGKSKQELSNKKD